jgi:predicted CoA-binding protein
MSQKVLVLGASMNPDRYSNLAINLLSDYKHDIIAVGLKEGKVRDVNIQTGTPKIEDLDTITLYIGPKNQQGYYDYILDLKPKRVIFNPGTENEELINLLKENGIAIEVACTLVLLRTSQFDLA